MFQSFSKKATVVSLCIILLISSLATAEITSIDTVFNNGNPDNRVDLIFMGDGWSSQSQDAEMQQELEEHIETFFKVPVYERYAKFFNVYLVHHFRGGPDGGWQTRENFEYYVDELDKALDQVEPIYMVSLNGRSGEGGNVGMASAALGLTSSNYDDLIGGHELGHGWHRLGDIYGGGGGESWPNATRDSDGEKWERWIGYTEPYNDLEVGAYPIPNSNYYRPTSSTCTMMADIWCGDPVTYDPVGREKVILDIYELVDPIDSHTPNDKPQPDPGVLNVKVIDPEIIKVDWYVNDELVLKAGGENFIPQQHVSSTGEYTIRAHAYDYAYEAAFSDRGGQPGGTPGSSDSDPLDWVRKDFAEITQMVEWDIIVNDLTRVAAGMNTLRGVNIRSITSSALTLNFEDQGDYTVDLFTHSGKRISRLARGYASNSRIDVAWDGNQYPGQVYLIRVSQGDGTVWGKWISR